MKATDDAGQQKPRKKPGRQAVSCAECRRLKMRCDRGNPCENCTKRGCAAICPDGTLTSGKHNRMILSNTEELHDKIEALVERIYLLENALRVLQSSVSTQPHPLLTTPTTESLISTIHVVHTREEPRLERCKASAVKEQEDTLDSFGTLSIGSDGETSYLGQTARADYLLNDSEIDDNFEVGRLPSSFYLYTWPCESPPLDESVETVLSFLPDLREAYALCEIYCNSSSLLGHIISRQTIREDFISHVYHLPNGPWADTLPTCPHRLALLFTIFSLGALFDPDRTPSNPEPDDYHHLARVALSFKSAIRECTVHAVLAILNMTSYLFLHETVHAHEQGWILLGIANKLALSMGLHQNSSRWRLNEEVSERRHITFWQLYLTETLASIQFGRPVSLSDAFIECPYPKQLDPQHATITDGNSKYLSWILHFIRLTRHIFHEVFGANTPSYSTVLELEVRVRELAEPDWHTSDYVDDSESTSLEKIQSWCVIRYKEFLILLLHRGFMIKGLSNADDDLSASKYSQSIKACFESSYRLIEGTSWITEQFPFISSRMSNWFAACVSSAVTMCILVTRCPTSEFARPAMEKLDLAYSVLQKASSINGTAQKSLETTRRLRGLARAAFDKSRLNIHGAPSQSLHITPADDTNTLDYCCGKTHIRVRKDINVGSTQRQGRRENNSSFTSVERPDEAWSDRMRNFGKAIAPSSGVSSLASCSDDLARFGFSGDSLHSSFTYGLDSSWSNFIQQVGF